MTLLIAIFKGNQGIIMIIAMPMSRDRLANHFTKAQQIGFFNEQHQLIASFANPALLTEGCSAKKAMLELIISNKTNIIIVQHIGERMLGKLLDAGISVSKGDSSLCVEDLLTSTRNLNLRLLDATQGRVSLNHEKKGGCCGGSSKHGKAGGCGCNSEDGKSGNKKLSGCGCSSKAKSQNESSMSLMNLGLEANALQENISYASFRKI